MRPSHDPLIYHGSGLMIYGTHGIGWFERSTSWRPVPATVRPGIMSFRQ